MNFDFKRMTQRELNIGLQEQKIRYGVGIGALLASVFMANIPLLVVGGVLVATAKLRWCPVYSGMSKSTVQPGEEMPAAGCCGGHH
ncbi:Protein of unknown function [Methylomagnum ishizawai]|uniref:Inner membrane protein YgaP-like transmembrane domain-containing protein n=1 Tax=Methylomagnum ishizawai TaxID=1760988 RepID=A0A1Y6D079_9GAMM|nr:DUF2892 domain-containing protein [Methylomagnum ishizawai]SMF93804.1 Protein of unknown function [Methylomagnum ishizawai]